jgi:hypothetical protein
MRTVVVTDPSFLEDTKQLLLQTLNARAKARGEDTEYVSERPTPKLIARGGKVVELQRKDDGERNE